MFGRARRSRAGWHTPCGTISHTTFAKRIGRRSTRARIHFSVPDGGEGHESDGEDVQPRFGRERGGVEEVVHERRVGEEQLRGEHRGGADEHPADSKTSRASASSA